MGLENGFRQYRSVKNWYEEMTSEQHKDAPWQHAVTACIKTGVGSYFPWVMALAGFVEAWSGGANSASPWEPLAFRGGFDLKLKGGLEETTLLWAHAFHMHPGNASNRAHRPVQAVPWGIFNFPSAPTVKVTPAGSTGGYRIALAKDPGILVNPVAGLDVTSIKVAFMGGDSKALAPAAASATPEAVATASMQPLRFRTEFMDIPTALSTPCTTVSAFDMIPFMRWEIRFKTKSATRLMDPEQVIVKNFRWVNPGAPAVAEPILPPEAMKKFAEGPANCNVM
jgi:hypothetical protein